MINEFYFLIDLSGDLALEFFRKEIIPKRKYIFEILILKCPEFSVRRFFTKLIAYFINTFVSRYELDLKNVS